MLSCPIAFFAGILGVSVIALGSALYAEVALGLEPCPLCIYQRIPFVVGIILGGAGLALRKRPKAATALLALTGVNFLVNAGIAFYHSGVERKWWASGVEGCNVSFEGVENTGGEINEAAATQTLLENILSAPTGNCAEIPWQDQLIGLSMANYNVALCLGITLFCLLSITLKRHPAA